MVADQNFSERDLSVVRWQLSSERIFMRGIADRCGFGYPRVMWLDPQPEEAGGEANYEALSNLLWLTCPYLNERIHDLEQQGLVDRIGGLILEDSALLSKMNSAHAKFYYLRKGIFEKSFGCNIPEEMIRHLNTGIAGIRDIATLKCLHAHFCHYRICEDNLAGMITARLLGGRLDCQEARCRHAY